MHLTIFPTCKSLTMLLFTGGQEDHQDPAVGSSSAQSPLLLLLLSKDDLTGAVFGRLPIFGPPPNLQEDDKDDEEEDMDNNDNPGAASAANKNIRLAAYQKGFGVTDRFFVGEAVRDILLSHEPSVSDSGVERGSVKSAAEHVWSLAQLMTKSDDDDDALSAVNRVGTEYAIVETLFSLIAQCSQQHGASAFSLVYLSRVVLELTRLQPSILSPAIAAAVSNLFTDYMPALVPRARYNLSRWFAFHLIHTGYQWPTAYWKHWEPFVLYGWGNSRGFFVKSCLEIMMENVSTPEYLVSNFLNGLHNGSILGDHLLASSPSINSDTSLLESFELDIKTRMAMNETPEMILSYLVDDELAESVSGVFATAAIEETNSAWWRTGLVLRGLLSPAAIEYERTKSDLEKARRTSADDNDDMQGDDGGCREDVLSGLLNAVVLYKSVLLGAMAKDSELQGAAELAQCETFLLEQLEGVLFYSTALLNACIQAFVLEKLVTIESIFKWLLGDAGVEEGNARVVLRWWEFATFALHLGMLDVVAGNASNAMTVDGDASHRSMKASAVLQFLDPLLSYAVRQVGTLLSSSAEKSKGKNFSPEEVNLVEGFKVVVTEAEAMYLSLLRASSAASGAELHDAWTESAVAGPRLASLLDGGGTPAVESLRRSLERM